MDSFEDVTDGEPPEIDPYEVLSLDKTATADQVKTAYRKAALQWHPGELTVLRTWPLPRSFSNAGVQTR